MTLQRQPASHRQTSWFRSWIGQSKPVPADKPAVRGRRFPFQRRLCVEPLEERCLLAADDFGSDVALQPVDGKIVVAGTVFNGTDFDFGLARYNPNGSPDTGFGLNGKVTTDFGGSDFLPHELGGGGLAIQTDGKIVLAGRTTAGGGGQNLALARYNANGSLDPTFGNGGKVITDFAGNFDHGLDVAIQTDGQIVVVGFSSNATYDVILARYNKTDGSPDLSFGVGGKVTTNFGGDDRAFGLAFQQDGKILVAGELGLTQRFGVARYLPNGAQDSNFGSGGFVNTDFDNQNSSALAVIVQGGNKIIAVGSARFDGNYGLALARYTMAGVLDTSFGSGGKLKLGVGFGGGLDDVTLQSDGKILAVGTGSRNFIVARFSPDGIPDSTFGTGGIVSTEFFPSAQDDAYGIVLQPDGRLIAAGFTYNGSNFDFAVARYDQSGLPDPTFDIDGKVTTDFAATRHETPLTVTIAQAADQADPTTASPIDFTVVFSEPVTGFTADDVDLSGTAGASLIAAVTGSGATYNVAVSGMTATGTVTATIHAGAAINATGNASLASSSADNTVMYVSHQPPIADAGGPYTLQVGSTIQLDASGSSDPDQAASTLTYEWDFDADGSYDDAVGIAPSFSVDGPTGPASTLVSARVTDTRGFVDTDSAAVTILSPQITVSYRGLTITSGGPMPVDLGPVAHDLAGASWTFTVRNNGTAPLTLGKITLPDGFMLSEMLNFSLAPGEADSFSITADTSTLGAAFGNVLILNNADTGHEHVFSFGIAAEVVRTPVIIIPGILGSMFEGTITGVHFVAFLDSFLRSITVTNGHVAIAAYDPLELYRDQVTDTYDTLIDSFIDQGYDLFDGDNPVTPFDSVNDGQNTDLFFAAYDWRLPVLLNPADPAEVLWDDDGVFESGVEYLDWWITTAKHKWLERYDTTDGFAVDIVAHSMGGLLARAYLQEEKYEGWTRDTVNHLIMLGTPNHGSVAAYQFWDPFVPVPGQPTSLQKAILAGDKDAIMRAMLRDAISWADSQGATAPMAADLVPSLRDLMPDYAFLWNRKTGAYVSPVTNYLLNRLNVNLDGLLTTDVLLIGLNHIDTPTEAYVNAPRGPARGALILSTGSGDGKVTFDERGLFLDGCEVFNASQFDNSIDHGSLPTSEIVMCRIFQELRIGTPGCGIFT